MGCLGMGRFECESFKSPEKHNICMYEWDITCKGCEILLQTAHTIFQKKKHTRQQFATEDSVNISKHKQLDIILFLPESKKYIQF